MARPNQGYYKEIKKRFQCIECEIENLNSTCELDSIDDIEILWNCLEKCNYLYDDCNSLINDLEALILSQKFEIEETETKYKKMIESLKNIKFNIISNYKTNKSAFGSQFSDSEMQSINGFAIDRE